MMQQLFSMWNLVQKNSRLESAAVDVVSCHISNEVNTHQCTQSSGRLHYNSSRAGAHLVVDPVNVTGGSSVLNGIIVKV